MKVTYGADYHRRVRLPGFHPGRRRAGGKAAWLWLAGSPPADAEVAQGWPHFYQWNGGTIYPGGMAADLDWAHPGVLEILRAAVPAPHVPAQPALPGPDW